MTEAPSGARAEWRRRPSVQVRAVWATRAGAALAIVPAVRLAAVGRRVIQTPLRQCISNGGLRMECTRGAASGCRHRPPPVICFATSWVSPLVAHRSNCVCATKLAQKLTYLPVASRTRATSRRPRWRERWRWTRSCTRSCRPAMGGGLIPTPLRTAVYYVWRITNEIVMLHGARNRE